MTEDTAKSIYFDLMDILAIVAKNQANPEFNFIEYLNERGYDI